MCNEVARRIALGQLREDWSELKVPLLFPEGLPNLATLDSIRITDPTLILRAAADGAGVDGVIRRWSWPGPSGKPVYNYRSEGRAFAAGDKSGRCLIPVDAFYEFTDPPADLLGAKPKRARKTKWRFTATDDAWFCVAGFWRTEPALGEGRAGEAFTLLTCEPGPDIAPYHHRQIVLPPAEQWAGWLDGSLAAADVCRPAAAGRFAAEQMG
ncbi:MULTISPECIES: SOS response-associated peptidase [unclassified Sphingomonas]|uniref:SOS response-associated peptidase family protein n=1 Tax=unclassified Sphingomonas TaxID=196159 RepID=UPI00226A9A2D|nr:MULTISPECIES: SOS response-associated peptidase [unclassified Sphingomonas]